MKFLSTTRRPCLVTLQWERGTATLFLVPPELATMLIWFLSSQVARLVALVAYRLASDFAAYLAGWRDDLRLIGWAAWLLARDRRMYCV